MFVEGNLRNNWSVFTLALKQFYFHKNKIYEQLQLQHSIRHRYMSRQSEGFSSCALLTAILAHLMTEQANNISSFVHNIENSY